MMLKKLELFMIKVLLLFLILCNSHYLDLLLKLSFMAFFWEIGFWKFRRKDWGDFVLSYLDYKYLALLTIVVMMKIVLFTIQLV